MSRIAPLVGNNEPGRISEHSSLYMFCTDFSLWINRTANGLMVLMIARLPLPITIKKFWKKKFISHRSWKAHDTWGHTVRSYEDRWRSCGEREMGSLLFLGSMVEPRGYSFRIYVIIKQSNFYDNSLPLSIYKCSCLFVIPDQDWIYKWVRRKKMILHHVCMNSLQWLLSKASLKIRHIFPGKQTNSKQQSKSWMVEKKI